MGWGDVHEGGRIGAGKLARAHMMMRGDGDRGATGRRNGIAALFGLVGEDQPGVMAAMSQRLAHWGSTATIWSPAPGIRLGRRGRLSPWRGRAATALPVAFAGTILNRNELWEAVGECRDADGVDPDGWLLWNLYRARGVDGFALINGPFAVALADPTDGDLVVAVDRVAAQPLYFARAGAAFAFASEQKALVALDGLDATANRDALAYLQARKYLPQRDTLLDEVGTVAPGGWVRFHGARDQAGSYRKVALGVTGRAEEAELAFDLHERLRAAAHRLVEGIDAVGVALSAGLDSTLTLGAVRAVAPDLPVHTFTVAFAADDPDLADAAASAHHFGAVHHEIIIEPASLAERLAELVWLIEDPIAREELLVYRAVAAAAAEHVPLVLYGTLADKLFAGMPRHLLIRLAARWPWARGPITEFYDYTQIGRPPRTLLGRLLRYAYFRGRHTPPPAVLGATAPGEDKRLRLAAVEALNTALLASLEHPSEVTAMARLHAPAGLRFGSIFHDRDVIECAFRVPDRLKINGNRRKYILRRAARGFLPPPLVGRPKGLVRAASNEAIVREFLRLADELLAPAAVRRRGLFDPAEVARLRRVPAGGVIPVDQFHHLWTLALTEIWARTFLDQRGRRPIRLDAMERSEERLVAFDAARPASRAAVADADIRARFG